MKNIKPWLMIECIVLAVLLVLAILVCVDLPAISQLNEPVKDTISLQGGTPTNPTPTQPDPTEPPTEPEPTWPQLPADRQLTAQQAFVYDVAAGEFTYLKGGKEDRVYPASITKLFTAYVALQYLEPSQQITAGDVLDLVGAGSSVAEIQKGDTLTVEQLVEAMLLPSGNDAAYLLADATGRHLTGDNTISGTAAVRRFLQEMNDQAKFLGMNGTQFTNPDGYHSDDHYTTFGDMVIMGKCVLANETIMKYASVPEETVQLQKGEVKWENTNELIRPGSQWYCPIATGLKTGQTPSAGSCLLSSFENEGGKWIIGVFGCPEKDDRFPDTLQLLNETLKAGA